MELSMPVQIAVSFFLLVGAFFTFLGSFGLVKLPDYYTRLHPPAKNTTLGLGCILFASALFFSVVEPGLTIRELLITVFLFLTAPVSAHLMGKAALHLDADFVDRHVDEEDEEEGDIYHPSERMSD